MGTNAKQNQAFADCLLPNWPLDEAVHWIQNNLEPEDVFSDEQLEDWAEMNGYVKEK